MQTDDDENATLKKPYEPPLLTDGISRQIIGRLDEIAKLIAQHRFFTAEEFRAETLEVLAKIAANGVRKSADLVAICEYLSSALIELDGDLDGLPEGTA